MSQPYFPVWDYPNWGPPPVPVPPKRQVHVFPIAFWGAVLALAALFIFVATRPSEEQGPSYQTGRQDAFSVADAVILDVRLGLTTPDKICAELLGRTSPSDASGYLKGCHSVTDKWDD